MPITNGRVVFSRKTAPADYENVFAEVEVSFTIDPDEEPGDVIRAHSAVAKNRVLELVGLRRPKPRADDDVEVDRS